MENFNLHFQEAQQTPCRINIKNPRQDIAESNFWKTKQNQNLKAASEKQFIIYGGCTRMGPDSSCIWKHFKFCTY